MCWPRSTKSGQPLYEFGPNCPIWPSIGQSWAKLGQTLANIYRLWVATGQSWPDVASNMPRVVQQSSKSGRSSAPRATVGQLPGKCRATFYFRPTPPKALSAEAADPSSRLEKRRPDNAQAPCRLKTGCNARARGRVPAAEGRAMRIAAPSSAKRGPNSAGAPRQLRGNFSGAHRVRRGQLSRAVVAGRSPVSFG